MSTDKRIVLHAGLHKTGTTSLQGFLLENRETLRALDVDVYRGSYLPGNHVELHAAAMRSERASPFKRGRALVVDDAFRQGVRERVGHFLERSPCRCVVFSAEGLSYLRHRDEMDRLRSLFPSGRLEIVMYLRAAADFLASYRSEMKRHGVPASADRDSFAYTAEDSWLIDFEGRLAPFREAFGERNVTVFDYDDECRTSGSVIPSFLRALGVEGQFDSRDWGRFFLNRSPGR